MRSTRTKPAFLLAYKEKLVQGQSLGWTINPRRCGFTRIYCSFPTISFWQGSC